MVLNGLERKAKVSYYTGLREKQKYHVTRTTRKTKVSCYMDLSGKQKYHVTLAYEKNKKYITNKITIALLGRKQSSIVY